jgi:probable rRNA maturation factor
VSVVVEVVDETDLGLPTNRLAELVRAVLEREEAEGAIVVALVEEQAIAELNGRDRGLPEPTDVLSYCAEDDDVDWPVVPDGEGVPPDLGEVIVCPAVVSRYAKEGDCEPGRQLAWTVIHGVLHVLGYDHERDGGEMRLREQALLEELGRLPHALSLPAGD